MGMLDNIRLALAGLWANKMRALLTMLGIIIGIGSVIAIVTVGDSLTGSINDSMQSLGAGNITVSLTLKSDEDEAGTTARGVNIRMFGPAAPAEEDLMTDAMIAEYRAAFGARVSAVTASENLGSGTASFGENEAAVSITGVDPEYQKVHAIELVTGRFITLRDMQGEKLVCVVPESFAEKLYGTADPVGQSFSLSVADKMLTVYIAGVAPSQDDGTVESTGSETYNVWLPLSTVKKLNGSPKGYQSFTVMGSDMADNTFFLQDTEDFFASYYTRSPSWTVSAGSMEQMVSTITEMLDTVELAIAAIASISLLVGGIGVMNIMLVSITERTREIGTRKALGAPCWAIRLQFITESVVICLIGGCIGILLGVGTGALAAQMLGYGVKPSVQAMLVAAGFSMVIGVFFGSYPAGKAAKMDPIEALRYE